MLGFSLELENILMDMLYLLDTFYLVTWNMVEMDWEEAVLDMVELYWEEGLEEEEAQLWDRTVQMEDVL